MFDAVIIDGDLPSAWNLQINESLVLVALLVKHA
jgi:hypothetical protein